MDTTTLTDLEYIILLSKIWSACSNEPEFFSDVEPVIGEMRLAGNEKYAHIVWYEVGGYFDRCDYTSTEYYMGVDANGKALSLTYESGFHCVYASDEDAWYDNASERIPYRTEVVNDDVLIYRQELGSIQPW